MPYCPRLGAAVVVAAAVATADAFAPVGGRPMPLLPLAGVATATPIHSVGCAPPRRAAWRAPASVRMAFDPLISGASTVASALFFFALETRPSGEFTVDDDSVVAKPSSIPGAGLGLYAARDLEAGAVLGTYPGRVWGAEAWLRYKGLTPAELLLDAEERAKIQQERQKKAEAYTWKLAKELESDEGTDAPPGATPATQTYTASFVIDPTTATGDLQESVPWIFNTFATMPTLLCRINEPGRGGDVNVVAEEGERSVAFVVERDVKAGEELFLDYGPYYDRSNYGGEQKVRDAVRAVLDSALNQARQGQGQGAKSVSWSYSEFVAAVEAGEMRQVRVLPEPQAISACPPSALACARIHPQCVSGRGGRVRTMNESSKIKYFPP
jgi:hypothetical protein